jgi:hypothetical protein
MNILMLGRWLPPPRRPVRGTREYQLARHLAREHRLTLAFVADNPDAAGAISVLRSEFGDLEFSTVPRGWKSLASAVRLATGESCTLSYFRSEALRTRLAERLRRTAYDLVFVSSSTMIRYALEVDPAIPLVADFGGVGSEWWIQQAARGTFPGTRFFRTEAARLRIAETAAARRAARCVVDSVRAARIVETFKPTTPPIVIPDGVDVETVGHGLRQGTTPTLVINLTGTASAALGESGAFWGRVVPVVRARVPSARVVAVVSELPPAGGRGPAGLELIGPGQDIRLLLHSRAVTAVAAGNGADPLPGALESMAVGVPVVMTSGVRERLGAGAGVDLRTADDPVELGRHVAELLESDADRRQAGEAGRHFAGMHWSWDVHAARLASVLAAVVKGPVVAPPAPAEPAPVTARIRG